MTSLLEAPCLLESTSHIKQTDVCHADTIQLLHVAYMEQSAHQTCSPISTRGAVNASD